MAAVRRSGCGTVNGAAWVLAAAALLDYASAHSLLTAGGYLPGDLVFLRFDKKRTSSQHIGLVEGVLANGRLRTIEGNIGLENDANGGQVQRRVRDPRQTLGAYRPEYEEENDMDQAAFNKLADAWLESRAELAPSIQTEEGQAARTWAGSSWETPGAESSIGASVPGSRSCCSFTGWSTQAWRSSKKSGGKLPPDFFHRSITSDCTGSSPSGPG